MALEIEIVSARHKKRTKADGTEVPMIVEVSYAYTDSAIGPDARYQTAMRFNENDAPVDIDGDGFIDYPTDENIKQFVEFTNKNRPGAAGFANAHDYIVNVTLPECQAKCDAEKAEEADADQEYNSAAWGGE